ncbi:hypothetical protein [Pseudonocardia zijingensis]|uniref:hypothetical protein n=1 Tax=Pseudonocardia zijingensis TaxID=153376 RepID=UPI0031DC16DE
MLAHRLWYGEAAHGARFAGGHQGGVVAGAAAGELGQQPRLPRLRPPGEPFEPHVRVDQLRIRQPGRNRRVGVDLQGEQPGQGGVAPGAVLHVTAQVTFDGRPVEGVLELRISGIEHVFDDARHGGNSQS